METPKNPDIGAWTEQLACPVCLQSLRFDDASVACDGCGRVYPILDGIPVLIAERATNAAQEMNAAQK